MADTDYELPLDDGSPPEPGKIRPLPMKVAERNGWTVLRLQEPSLMDVAVIEALHQRIRDLIGDGKTQLVLDFKKVQYISSSMVGVLVAAQQEVQTANGKLILSTLNERLVELLKLTRLESMFTVAPSARDALKSVGAA